MSNLPALVKDRALSPQQRERRIIEAFERSVAIAMHSDEITVKASTVRDARTLKAAAEAYQLSTDTVRRIAEGAILCLHTLGLSLVATYGGRKPATYWSEVGVPLGVCRQAVVLADFPETLLRKVFDQDARDGVIPGPSKAISSLRLLDPTYRAEQDRVRKIREAETAEAERKRRADPDYAAIRAVEREFGFFASWNVFREIVRLRKMLAARKDR